MSAARRSAALLVFAAALAAFPVEAQVSEAIDQLWNYDDPAASEARFRAEAAKADPLSRQALELQTQIARAQGLQRAFDAAHRTLDAVEEKLDGAAIRVRVRYLLERGRVLNSSGSPERAVPLFTDAAAAAGADPEAGAEFYRIDALHMLGIAAPQAARASWNQQALAAAERSKDPRARGWRASLLNNLGWLYFERGDPSTALAYWQRALQARESMGDATRTRIARWTVARGLRAVGRLDEAQAIQTALADELDRAGAPDGYVFEELAEIASARGDRAAASTWARRALPLLASDAGFAAREPARLARLQELAAAGTSAPKPPERAAGTARKS